MRLGQRALRRAASRRNVAGLGAGTAALLAIGTLLRPAPDVSPHSGAAAEQEHEDEREREATGAAAAQEMRWRQRSSGRGFVPRDGLLRAKEQVEAMQDRRYGPLTDAGLWTWDWLGPGNIGGRVRAIAVHPTVPNRIFLGSASGGLWRSDDAGASWLPVDDFLPSLAITSIVFDPTAINRMYAATGEGFTSDWTFAFDRNYVAPPGAGIFQSDDGGVTWNQLANTGNDLFDYVNRLAIDPATGALYAATAPHLLWKTTNQGASWTVPLIAPGPVADVEVHPTVVNRVLVGTTPDDDASGEVFYSTDSGATWTEETTGAIGKLPEETGRCEVAFASGADVAYVLLDRGLGEVWRSTDIGSGNSTWTLQATLDVFGTQGWYDNMIWVDPTNPNFVVIGGVDLWRSTNGGTTFAKISDWSEYHNGLSAHADQHILAPHPGYDGFTNRRVYVGNDGGIQTAANIATVTPTSGWTNLANGLGITQFYGGAASPDGSLILGGAQDNDKLRYTGDPADWFQAEPGDGGLCAVDPTDSDVLYSEYVYLDILKSTDGGDTWADATTGLLEAGLSSQTLFIAPLTLDPNDPDILWAGGLSLWRTTNGAGSWSSRRDPISGVPRCTVLAVRPGNSAEVWAGYEDGTVARTTNSGASWTNVDGGPPGLPDRWVMDIAVSPHFADEAVVTFAGYAADNVWVTVDGGSTWILRTGAAPDTLPALQVNTVTYHPTNVDWIYIGTDLGVFASEDFGAHWNVTPRYAANDGPAYVEVADLFWYGDHLVAATYGRGMYVSRPLDLVYVDGAHVGSEDGSQARPYDTVGEGIAASGNGTALSVRTGTYVEGSLLFDRRGTVTATGGTVVVR